MTAKEQLTDFGLKVQKIYNPELIDLLVWRYIKGKTQEQTAEAMGVSLSYEKSQERLALWIFETENNVQNIQKK